MRTNICQWVACRDDDALVGISRPLYRRFTMQLPIQPLSFPDIEKFLTQLNIKKEVAKNDVRFSGAIVTVDEHSGKAVKIERVHRKLTAV